MLSRELAFNNLCKWNSTMPDQGSHELSHVLPNGIWLRFDFGDSHPVSLSNHVHVADHHSLLINLLVTSPVSC